MSPRVRLPLAVLLAAALAAALLLLADRHQGPTPLARAVAQRQAALGRCLHEKAKAKDRDGAERESPGAPESSEDIARINAEVGLRIGADSAGGMARAVQQRERLAAKSRAELIPGSGGTWAPYGKGPLKVDDPTYPSAYGDGFGHVNGRINDLLYVPQTKKLYAAVAQGGLWESTDVGKTWTSIAGDLPENGPVLAFAEDPVNANLLFAGTEFGAYFTSPW